MSIPTPPDLAVGRVSWTIGRGSSRALAAGRGVVRFKASAVAVNFSTVTVLPDPVETPVLAGTMTPVDLIQNDPEVWNWVVEPLVGVQWEPFPIDVDGPVDLATAAVTPGKGPVRAVKGETGYSLTGEVRYQDGEVEFGIEDGSWTDPVTMPPGPPGPSNQLLIGTVDTSAAGAPAEASISGESPTQYLNLTLPRGEKPAISWQGSTIVVDGALGPDLRGATGQDSTVPGPANELSIGTVSTGAPGSQAAVTITGTAPNQTLGFAIPRGDQGVRGPAGNVKIERPEPGVWDFQPEELDVQVSDVAGLAAELSAKVDTTDPRLSDSRPPTAHKHALADVDGITIDTSVGTRVLVGGHMVHGDTGARDVTAAFASGLASDNAGRIRIWKRGSGVVVEFSTVTLAPGSGTIVWASVLPTGWQPARSLVSFSAARSTAFDTAQMIGINGSAMYWLAELKVGSSVTSNTTRPASPVSGQIEFYAPGWPTTLPGTPA